MKRPGWRLHMRAFLNGSKRLAILSGVSCRAERNGPSSEGSAPARNVTPIRNHPRDGQGTGVLSKMMNRCQMNKYMLWSRFAALNLAGAAGLALAYVNGWAGMVLEADASRITLVIASLFAFGLIATGVRVHKVTRELNHVCEGSGGRLDRYHEALRHGSAAHRALEIRLFSRIAHVRHIANALVLLGLIGTVIGFIMALSNVTAEAASDVGRVGPMIATLISGMAVALYTTLVGAIFNLWLGANYQLLTTGTATLAAALLDTGGKAGPILPERGNGSCSPIRGNRRTKAAPSFVT